MSVAEKLGVSPWLVAAIVSLATFMEVLDTTITNVSLSHIAGSLAASPEESTWVLTSYLVANGIVLPISGWLSNVFGRTRFFLFCIAGFTLASFACGAATSLPMLVIFRLLQGFAGGGLQPTQQAIILDSFPPEKRGQAFGITSITIILAPIIGPTLGGFITDNFTWRWIFFINVPVGIIAFMLTKIFVKDPAHAIARGSGRIDYIGLGLIALGLGAMQIVLDKGQQEDWFSSGFIVTFTVLSALCLSSAILWLLQRKDPIIELRLLKEPGFGFACILIFFTGFALYGSSALLPLLVQTQFGYDATLAGLILSPGGLAVVFLMPVSGKLVSKIQARYMIAVGLSLTAMGMFYTSTLSPATDYEHFVWMRIFQVIGLPFLFIPISTLAFAKIPKEKNNKASALYALARNLGGSVGIAIMATYVSRHQQIHQSHLSEHLNPANPVYQQRLNVMMHLIISHGQAAITASGQALGMLYRELLHQSAILGYADGFRMLGMLITFAAAMTIFLPANKLSGKPVAGAAH